MGEVGEESEGAVWGAGDKLVAHDAEMGELTKENGAIGCGSEGRVPVAVGHEEGEVGAEGMAVM